MAYISKYDTKFITFVNRKYNMNFDYFDDYIVWAFDVLCKENETKYYTLLEQDIMDYSNFQTGSPTDRTRKRVQ